MVNLGIPIRDIIDTIIIGGAYSSLQILSVWEKKGIQINKEGRKRIALKYLWVVHVTSPIYLYFMTQLLYMDPH
jgi:hypothetical protein